MADEVRGLRGGGGVSLLALRARARLEGVWRMPLRGTCTRCCGARFAVRLASGNQRSPSSRAEILMHAALIGYEGSENLAACFHLMRTRRHDRAHRLAARGRVPRRMDGVAAAVDQDGLDSCCGGQGSSGSSLSLSCSWVVVDKGGLCCGRSGLARNLAPAKVMSGEAGDSRIVRDMASVGGCVGWERDGAGSEQLECSDRAAGGGDGTGAA